MIHQSSQKASVGTSGGVHDGHTNSGSNNNGSNNSGSNNNGTNGGSSHSTSRTSHPQDHSHVDDTILPLTKSSSSLHMNEFTDPSTLGEMRDTRLLGADFLTAAAELYALVPFTNVSIGARNQGMCLILAATSLLDAVTFDELLTRSIDTRGAGNGSSTASTNDTIPAPLGPIWAQQCLNRVCHNATTARSLLVAEGADLLGLRFVGGDDDDEGLMQLRNMALVLEFAALCKMSPHATGTSHGMGASGSTAGQGVAQGLAQGPGQGQGQGLGHDNNNLQTFLMTKENDLLSLSASQLKLCADIASDSKGGTVDVVRKLLTYSLQICSRGAPPDHILMGELFRRLISLSSSRRDALDHVRKFEQLATGCAFSRNADMGEDEGPHTCPFDVEDVDYVASTSFNYGLTMLDFGQAGLAEVFVSKALSLLPFASSTLQLWRDRIQETYMAVLQAKEDSSSLGDGLSTLATLAVSLSVTHCHTNPLTHLYTRNIHISIHPF